MTGAQTWSISQEKQSGEQQTTLYIGEELQNTVVPTKLGLFSLVGFSIVLFQIFCEIGKNVSNFSIQYYNDGHYPLPQTLIVVIVELLKLLAIVMRSGCQFPSLSSSSLRGSLKYIFPSLIYAVNNNIWMYGLVLVPPPIWVLLCSFRTLVTVTVYKFILKREVTLLQFVGAVVIVASIVSAKVGDLISTDEVNAVPTLAIILAMITSVNSVVAAVYMESLFKTSGQNFMEQQCWLYSYGALVAFVMHVITSTNVNPLDAFEKLFSGSEGGGRVQVLFAVALLFASVGGIVVAAILKMLDNVVKEYSGAVANLGSAVLCALLFPERFTFTPSILVAMVLLSGGIYLYETAKPKPAQAKIVANGSEGESSEPLL